MPAVLACLMEFVIAGGKPEPKPRLCSSKVRLRFAALYPDELDFDVIPPGGDPGGELTGTYVQEGVLRWGCGGAEPPRSRPAQRKKMGSIGCLKRFSTED